MVNLFIKKTRNFVVTSTLPPEFGGRTKSLLQRTKSLSENFNLDFTLVSTNYHPNYYMIYQNYQKNTYVNGRMDFLNIYDYFSGRTYKNRKVVNHPIEVKGYEHYEVEEGKVYRYFKEGNYERYRQYDKKTGNLKIEDIMDFSTRKRKERLEYNNFGVCHKRIIYKRNTTNKLEEIFYNDKGEVYLIKNFNGAENSKLVRIYLLQNKNMRMFENESGFFQYAFDQILQGGGVTFCDARLLDKALLESNVDTQKFFVLHSSHNIDGNLRKSYKYLVENAEQATKIIVLTHEQSRDLIDMGVDFKKIAVIPHSMEEEDFFREKQSREKKFVYLGRLAPEKQIPHIIEAFALIQDKYPGYVLDIYGDGEAYGKILQLIDEKKLTEFVKLMGRTNNIPAVFEKSIASLVTSEFEGFGLVIMESLHHGCPVISYDFKYGPKDLIEDGKNGYIVEKNNIDLLADTMIKIINNPITDVKLSSEFYSPSTIDKWGKLLNQR